MAQKTAVMIDASCELPRSFIDNHKLVVIPTRIQLGDTEFQDNRDARRLLSFYSALSKSSQIVATQSATTHQLTKLLKDQLAVRFDSVQAITLHSEYSGFYKNVRDAAFVNKNKFQEWRRAANLDPKFRMRVLDSELLFTGHGLLVYEAVRLLSEKAVSVDKLKPAMEQMKSKIDTYVAVQDLEVVRRQTQEHQSEDKEAGLSWLDYQTCRLLRRRPVMRCFQGSVTYPIREKSFDSAIKEIFALAKSRIEAGLFRSVVNTSYAGNLAEIRANPEFQEFIQFAKSRQVRILLSMMGAEGASLAGPRAFSLSFASDRTDY